jgi:sugar lactone lactonase YvrE
MRFTPSAFLSSVLAAVLLTACSVPAVPTAAQSVAWNPPTAPAAGPIRSRLSLYVASAGANQIVVFAPGAFAPLRTISKGLSRPMALAFDAAGNLYAGNTNSVTVYGRHSSKLVRRIDLSGNGGCLVYALAFDRGGFLYVACVSPGSGPGFVAIYRPGATRRFATITDRISQPVDVGVNGRGQIFVANASPASGQSGWISVYSPRGTHARRVIDDGFSPTEVPWRLAFDRSDNLYVANTHDVTVYAPGESRVERTINRGVSFPHALAFDAAGSLYVANCTSACSRRGSVTVFAAGKSRPTRRITHGIHTPVGLVVDSSGNLYVANRTGYDVSVYSQGHSLPLGSLSPDGESPSAIALGP